MPTAWTPAVPQDDDFIRMDDGGDPLAMMILVVPGRLRSIPSRIFASVAVSTALVESSRISALGFFSKALAIQSLCFCPPDTFTPPWPRSVSYSRFPAFR